MEPLVQRTSIRRHTQHKCRRERPCSKSTCPARAAALICAGSSCGPWCYQVLLLTVHVTKYYCWTVMIWFKYWFKYRCCCSRPAGQALCLNRFASLFEASAIRMLLLAWMSSRGKSWQCGSWSIIVMKYIQGTIQKLRKQHKCVCLALSVLATLSTCENFTKLCWT